MFCKTIILSNSQNLSSNSPKGILTLSKENNSVKGKIRLYNLSSLPMDTKVGLYINEKVHICKITKKPHHYEFDLNENVDITQSIYCAIIDNSDNSKTVLLEGGSFNGFYFTDSPFDAVLEAKDEQLEKDIDNALKDMDNECKNCNCANCEYKKYFYQHYSSPNNQIEHLSDDNLNIANNAISSENNCDDTNCVKASNEVEDDILDDMQSQVIDNLENEAIESIKNIPLSTSDITNSTTLKNEDIKNSAMSGNNDVNPSTAPENNDGTNLFTPENDDIAPTNKPDCVKSQQELGDGQNELSQQNQTDFLNDIIYQLDEMLIKYPQDEILNNIIPNSRFVRVNGESPYVLGVIYEDNQLKYIAYGVPAKYNTLPPSDLGNHYQWLPLNPRDVMSDGYFMIYQNALNGTLVEIEFEN
ncbi:MAG: hypothetical protein IJ358_02300 [Clostridia bacterium]|nr:hypothetical protein [Clostridia bacterium]